MTGQYISRVAVIYEDRKIMYKRNRNEKMWNKLGLDIWFWYWKLRACRMSFSQYQRMPILKPLATNCVFVVSATCWHSSLPNAHWDNIFKKLSQRYIYTSILWNIFTWFLFIIPLPKRRKNSVMDVFIIHPLSFISILSQVTRKL